MDHHHENEPQMIPHCCPCGCSSHDRSDENKVSRRAFMGGTGLGAVALSGLSWSMLSAAEQDMEPAPVRKGIVVKPVLVYGVYTPRKQASWRPWGGIQTEDHAKAEVTRINGELKKLKAEADFPVEFLPLSAVKNSAELASAGDLGKADVYLIYAAGGPSQVFDDLAKKGKDCIFFVRHRSGPVYLWYEIISPRYLRQHTDFLKTKGLDDQDVVVDSQDEIAWRLRALCGVKNSLGAKVLTIGGAGGWAQPRGVVPDLCRTKWKYEITDCPYSELGKLIDAAKKDPAAVKLSKQRAAEYMKTPQTTLETKQEYVERCFLLEQVFRGLLKEADCRNITINGCMQTIMPMSETTACLTLSLLNDAGFVAFCESDFVVIPSGILLEGISGTPVFLNDPTYPHDGVITLAHCTAPRKMDGKTPERCRMMTHFESDYGAAPKVEMKLGQEVTLIAPDFKAERWLGLSGKIAANPFLPICRAQVDVAFEADSQTVAERMPGFHWMLGYGNHLNEVGYALKRVPIEWDCLG